MRKLKQFNLTAVFQQDEKKRGFTAYFAEFPYIVSQGKTEDEATKMLLEIFETAINDQRKQGMERAMNAHTRSFSMSVSG